MPCTVSLREGGVRHGGILVTKCPLGHLIVGASHEALQQHAHIELLGFESSVSRLIK